MAAGGSGGREVLEPRLTAEQGRHKLVLDLLAGRPDIQPVGRSSLLDSVRDFLPKMAKAEAELAAAIEQGGSQRLNVENVEGREEVIEMDIAVVQDGRAKPTGRSPQWTSDSEADSTPSPSENSYTSDTDVSSSSSCSSSSSEEGSQRPAAGPGQAAARKRPLVQEVATPPARSKAARQS